MAETQNRLNEIQRRINQIDDADEPSSIIIDTKVNQGGVPVLSKKQREEFLRRNQGIESASDDDSKADQPKTKKVSVKTQMNLQEQITQIIFKFIEQGSIEKLKKE